MPVIPEAARDEKLYRIRHSLAHVLAQAVQKLHPGTLLGFGPPIDDGFYYDFIFPAPLHDEDLSEIERAMRAIIAERQPFSREDLPVAEAMARLQQMKEPHKLEYARELVEKQGLDSLRFYTNGPFVDMCQGPHAEHTGELPPDAFKLHGIAGAYWRGDERNVMMSRIYGYAYRSRKDLEKRVAEVEQARQRDYRKLGAQLRIFVLRDEVGRGLPLWLPNGAAIRHELEKLAYEMEFAAGYVRVATPHITRRGLYVASGHIPLYENVMYPPMELVESVHGEEEVRPGGDSGSGRETGEREAYYLKPMNCPHHHMVYASELRSYRDLPLRLAEYGTVYRFERGGQLQGLARVRGMTMNDAHIYVTPEQLRDEFKAVMDLHRRYYELFGFSNYYLRLSLWDPEDPKRRNKYVDDPEAWAHTERLVQEAMEDLGLYYTLSKGEAAFYGPKVDFQFRTVLEKEFTVSTNQVDFAQPARLGLEYIDRDGKAKMPYVIHRAPLGTHERFVAFLIEHYGGAFPTWLAPVQALVIPISDRFLDYGRKVQAALRQHLVRAEIDEGADTTGKKIREGSVRKIPLLLVVGAKEEEENTVTVRRYGIQEQRAMPLENLVAMVREEIAARRHVTAW